MEQPTVIHSTFVIERNYAVAPERVFAAFSEPASKRKWFGESGGHRIERFEIDFRAGGEEKLHYRFGEGTPFPGTILTNEGTYQEIVPNARIVMSSAMTIGGRFVSAALVTFEFLPAETGTDLIFTYQGAFLEGSGGPEMREVGWRTLFGKLGDELGV